MLKLFDLLTTYFGRYRYISQKYMKREGSYSAFRPSRNARDCREQGRSGCYRRNGSGNEGEGNNQQRRSNMNREILFDLVTLLNIVKIDFLAVLPQLNVM